ACARRGGQRAEAGWPRWRSEGGVVVGGGERVPAAAVWLTDIAEGAPARERATADGDGCFLFAHVPVRSAWLVCATAPGCCTAFARVQDAKPVPTVGPREAGSGPGAPPHR